MLGYHGYYTYYIHWAPKFATSANIGNKAAYHIHWLSKLATSTNKRRSKKIQNWNHFRRSQETISWVPIMLARCLASLLTFSCLALKSSSSCLLHQKVCIWILQGLPQSFSFLSHNIWSMSFNLKLRLKKPNWFRQRVRRAGASSGSQ